MSSLTFGKSFSFLVKRFAIKYLSLLSIKKCFVYSSLTGVSPFAGENDRATALNIRNYNVAFEESMFSDFCKEAKGFVIKLLVVDKLYAQCQSNHNFRFDLL